MGEHARPRGRHDVYNPPLPQAATAAPTDLEAAYPAVGPGSTMPQGHTVLEAGTVGEPATPVIIQAGTVCLYCQAPLDNGESHFHGGQPNPAGVATVRDEWEAIVRAYSDALEAAYQRLTEADRLAWDVYIAAKEAAERRYEHERTAATAAYDKALVNLGPPPVRG